ncbi:hypothetical protein [Lacihabitans soyangensis]|uniref:Uncharacterized protein n=1 Tax=Lacihabitans soyangensis TaxID=869394 RepID=A0AAE3KRM5_9BACT|nr:hypothetical protein [Lacihabitans soyangensis]MCP9762367.1 hypothetical protein [Lacihabitans soyangensis]
MVNPRLRFAKKDFENEIAKDIVAGRNWQMRVFRTPSGCSSDAVLQDKIIVMVENGQLLNVKNALINCGKTNPASRALLLRDKIKTL